MVNTLIATFNSEAELDSYLGYKFSTVASMVHEEFDMKVYQTDSQEVIYDITGECRLYTRGDK